MASDTSFLVELSNLLTESETQHAPSARASSGLTPAEADEAMERLRKDNFSLKLRVFYLEERIRKLKPGADAMPDSSAQKVRKQTRTFKPQRLAVFCF